MFAAFGSVRALQELLRHLSTAARWPTSRPVLHRVLRLVAEADGAAAALLAAPADPAEVDVAALRREAGEVLADCSERARAGQGAGEDLSRADLAGQDLRGAALRRASLRGALLVGTRLEGADLRLADLLGADLRGTDLRGADLREALFVTTAQLASARGDRSTRLSPTVPRPSTWV
jgi:hypothetical protein